MPSSRSGSSSPTWMKAAGRSERSWAATRGGVRGRGGPIRPTEIGVPHGAGRTGPEEWPLDELPHRRGLTPVVDDRDDETLKTDTRSTAVSGHQRHRCRQRATGTHAGDDDARVIDIHVVNGPAQAGEAVLDTLRERVLGDDPVVNRHHECAEHGQPSIVRREHVGAQAESPAVKTDDQRKGGVHALRAVQQHADVGRVGWSRDEAFLHHNRGAHGIGELLSRVGLYGVDCHVDLLSRWPAAVTFGVVAAIAAGMKRTCESSAG